MIPFCSRLRGGRRQLKKAGVGDPVTGGKPWGNLVITAAGLAAMIELARHTLRDAASS